MSVRWSFSSVLSDALTATGYLRVVVRDDPMLAMLAAFFLWGFIRFLPGLRVYGIYAVRDFALVYYCLFAFFIAAALERSPEILERLIINSTGSFHGCCCGSRSRKSSGRR